MPACAATVAVGDRDLPTVPNVAEEVPGLRASSRMARTRRKRTVQGLAPLLKRVRVAATPHAHGRVYVCRRALVALGAPNVRVGKCVIARLVHGAVNAKPVTAHNGDLQHVG